MPAASVRGARLPLWASSRIRRAALPAAAQKWKQDDASGPALEQIPRDRPVFRAGGSGAAGRPAWRARKRCAIQAARSASPSTWPRARPGSAGGVALPAAWKGGLASTRSKPPAAIAGGGRSRSPAWNSHSPGKAVDGGVLRRQRRQGGLQLQADQLGLASGARRDKATPRPPPRPAPAPGPVPGLARRRRAGSGRCRPDSLGPVGAGASARPESRLR